MIKNKTIGLVTRCMGRKALLEQALATWTPLAAIDRIVIVDWGMTEDLLPLAGLDPRIVLVRVPGKSAFDPGAAQNIGAAAAATDLLFFLDADVKLPAKVLDAVDAENAQKFYRAKSPHDGGLTGSCIMTAAQFKAVGGYRERIDYYGLEDGEIFNRLKRRKFEASATLAGMIHISHAPELRTKNFSNKMRGALALGMAASRMVSTPRTHAPQQCTVIERVKDKEGKEKSATTEKTL